MASLNLLGFIPQVVDIAGRTGIGIPGLAR
jgi:hypothetical protein